MVGCFCLWYIIFCYPPVVEFVVVEPVEIEVELELTGDALVIADCESGARLSNGSALENTYDIKAQNPVSSASGAFQFIDSTWEWVTDLPAPASDYDLETQLEAFEKLWDGRNGMSHWNASKSCWGSNL